MDKKGFVIVEGVLHYEGDGADGRRLVLSDTYLTFSEHFR